MDAIILLGAPGSGKGTIAEKIKLAKGLTHVSTGDMLRIAVKNGTEVGKRAEAYMKKGELVPDGVIIKLVEDRFDAGQESERYLFDGFPRTTAQADLLEKSLEKRGGRISRVFLLETPREVIISRLTGRRVCRKCGATFHVKNIPPKKSGICDVCGGELYQRPDDCEETIVNRLDVYVRQTESLIARYAGMGLLVKVDSDRNADQVSVEMAAGL